MHRSEAIILRRVAYGDADWIVTFFDRAAGRMSGMAKSARASRRRFGGALEPGSVVRIRYSMCRASNLVRLDEAELVQGVLGVMKSLGRINATARALGLALAFLPEHQPAPEKFDLLCEWLTFCNQNDPTAGDVAVFEFKWLGLCGYKPHLFDCAVCGRQEGEAKAWSFDFTQGGLVCSKCRGKADVSLTRDALQALQAVANEACGNGGAGAFASNVLRRYTDHILGRPLKVGELS